MSDADLRTYLDSTWVKRYQNYHQTARDWWAEQTGTRSLYGVEQSTVRSYSTGIRGAAHGPTAIFNEWAKVQADALNSWPAGASRQDFEELHSRLAETLQAHWRARLKEIRSLRDPLAAGNGRICEELSVGQTYKLVDLFVRHLWITAPDKSAGADGVFPHAHMPLDRKSMHVLSATFSGILMAPKFSMGMVVQEAQYRWCQALVRLACETAGGGTPLLFDRFAWDDEHANALYGK